MLQGMPSNAQPERLGQLPKKPVPGGNCAYIYLRILYATTEARSKRPSGYGEGARCKGNKHRRSLAWAVVVFKGR